jgi:putative ABC transport system ATP-binding protein
MNILEMKNITYSYANSKKKKVLSGVNQKFELGKFYAIVGKSGTGKSTLLSILAGLDKAQTGKILFKNEDIEKKGYSNHRKNNISLVFQNYNLIDYLSPIENIRLVNKSVDESILFELGLDKKQIKRNVMKLSGGQQQRVAIARALVSDAPVILADEPTGNLDSVTAGEIINILKKTLAKDRNKCVIVVTHSKEVADSADIVLELSGKKLKKVNEMNLEVE